MFELPDNSPNVFKKSNIDCYMKPNSAMKTKLF